MMAPAAVGETLLKSADYEVYVRGADSATAERQMELTLPMVPDIEIAAARAAGNLARELGMASESIDEMAHAMIEACINAAEHSDSPDRRIYQRFAIETDRITITVTNKGKAIGSQNGEASKLAAGSLKGARGRGLKIIRALMDEVMFEPTDDGTSLVMTKILKRPQDGDE